MTTKETKALLMDSKQVVARTNAFTLAEVLLTLAIIGVVAALTIPAVVTKATKQQYVTGLKKAFNTVKSVEREAVREHGYMENWDWSGTVTQQFEKYFLPHFDVLKNCKATTEKGCFAEGLSYLNNNPMSHLNTTSYYKIVTSDGISWAYNKSGISTPMAYQGIFTVDVNGLKGPNKYGRDIFDFLVYPSNQGIEPNGSYTYTGGSFPTTDADSHCNTSSNGSYCTSKVLAEGAMNY